MSKQRDHQVIMQYIKPKSLFHIADFLYNMSTYNILFGPRAESLQRKKDGR